MKKNKVHDLFLAFWNMFADEKIETKTGYTVGKMSDDEQ
jgi:hypothetical protein